jgi:predicted peptidase
VFAAAVPLCGSGRLDRAPYRTTYGPSELKKIVDMPMWVFQGAEDENVPVAGVRQTVAALRKLGSKVKYTEYAGVGHAVWEKAYEEPELIDWMFAQRRAH